MDYDNDVALQKYCSQMLSVEGSPSSFASSEEEDASGGGDYFYEALVCQDASDEEDEEASDEGTPVKNDDVGGCEKKKAKAKRKRDPNKPKGFVSASLMYSNAQRLKRKAENPDATFGEVARMLVAEYKALPSKEKAVWEKANADEKARYKREMESYVPPPTEVSNDGDEDSDSGGEGEEETIAVEVKEPKAKKPRRKKKDPNAPKRPLSAWQLFTSGDSRKQILAEHPEGISYKELMVTMAERWKSVTPEQRAPLVALADADRARYEREMAVYNAGTDASVSISE